MQIERIEQLDKKRKRIFFDDNIKLILYNKEIKLLALEEGSEITNEQYKSICEEILLPRAKKRALFLLEKMPRTRYQLKEKLSQGYDEEIVKEAIEYVEKFNYLDDYRYVCNYIRIHCLKKSRKQMQMELLKKGIEKDVIAQAVEVEYQEDNEENIILKWMEKRKYSSETADWKEKQKMYQFLMRKGFLSEDIMRNL